MSREIRIKHKSCPEMGGSYQDSMKSVGAEGEGTPEDFKKAMLVRRGNYLAKLSDDQVVQYFKDPSEVAL